MPFLNLITLYINYVACNITYTFAYNSARTGAIYLTFFLQNDYSIRPFGEEYLTKFMGCQAYFDSTYVQHGINAIVEFYISSELTLLLLVYLSFQYVVEYQYRFIN